MMLINFKLKIRNNLRDLCKLYRVLFVQVHTQVPKITLNRIIERAGNPTRSA